MKNSFTLIELLVVIAIIGFLVNLSFTNYVEMRVKTRDLKRKSDLKEIQKALEMYRQNQPYPVYPTSVGNPPRLNIEVNKPWRDITSNTVYINKFPYDPLNLTNPTPYFYQSPRINNDNLTYLLCSCLESKVDLDAISCSQDPPCTNINCRSNLCFKLTEP